MVLRERASQRVAKSDVQLLVEGVGDLRPNLGNAGAAIALPTCSCSRSLWAEFGANASTANSSHNVAGSLPLVVNSVTTAPDLFIVAMAPNRNP